MFVPSKWFQTHKVIVMIHKLQKIQHTQLHQDLFQHSPISTMLSQQQNIHIRNRVYKVPKCMIQIFNTIIFNLSNNKVAITQRITQ
jgi:hypothetical protein